MTRWSTTTRHEPESINKGNKYELKDRVSIEQLNNMTENAFYAMDKASDAIKKAEEALGFAQGSGTTVFVKGEPVSQFNADLKADVTDLNNYYTKEQVDDLLGEPVDIDLSNYYTKDQTYSKQEVDDKLANLDVDVDFSDYYNKTQTDGLLNTKADKTELNNYVTNTALESKGYLTSLPVYVARKDTDNNFYAKQSFQNGIKFSNKNALIEGLLGAGEYGVVGSFIKVDNTNNVIEIGSSLVSKVTSPNIIQAQGLTDGTTTKTMTEILQGGGAGTILRRWS